MANAMCVGVDRQELIDYRIVHDLCVRCGKPLDNQTFLYCLSCQQIIDGAEDAECLKIEDQSQQNIAPANQTASYSQPSLAKIHEARRKPKENKRPIYAADFAQTILNEQIKKTNTAKACKSKTTPVTLADHPCRNCVWGRWEGTTMFCPFPAGVCEQKSRRGSLNEQKLPTEKVS